MTIGYTEVSMAFTRKLNSLHFNVQVLHKSQSVLQFGDGKANPLDNRAGRRRARKATRAIIRCAVRIVGTSTASFCIRRQDVGHFRYQSTTHETSHMYRKRCKHPMNTDCWLGRRLHRLIKYQDSHNSKRRTHLVAAYKRRYQHSTCPRHKETTSCTRLHKHHLCIRQPRSCCQ